MYRCVCKFYIRKGHTYTADSELNTLSELVHTTTIAVKCEDTNSNIFPSQQYFFYCTREMKNNIFLDCVLSGGGVWHGQMLHAMTPEISAFSAGRLQLTWIFRFDLVPDDLNRFLWSENMCLNKRVLVVAGWMVNLNLTQNSFPFGIRLITSIRLVLFFISHFFVYSQAVLRSPQSWPPPSNSCIHLLVFY